MTHNQIDYAKLQEDKRHNQEVELNARNVLAENSRHNKETERIQSEANVINSNHYANMDAESIRHNQQVEAETNRHNMAMEGIQQRQNQLTAQQNAIRLKELAETEAHNTEMEWIGHTNAQANLINANAADRNATTNFFNSGTQSNMQQSNASLNKARETEVANQNSNRTANTIINAVNTVANIATQIVKASAGGGVIVGKSNRRISGATR